KEPITEAVNRDLIDCYIIPCVGISNNKRIGYGKGYYDRFLEGYKGLVIGITYKDFVFDCNMDNHDRELDLVVLG
ncbi:MAG: hypothetical protein K6B64_01835, partial [Acholeplasmatales bacterium]|nr:hypothetical protein [Acholeplasmatales bacterium]